MRTRLPSGAAQNMDLFDNLVDEHRLLSRTFDALSAFVSDIEGGKEVDLVELNRFVTFLREFGELIHHAKEEAVLFPAMVRVGYSKAGAPIAHVQDEHRRERALLFEIRQAAVRSRYLSSEKKAHLVGLLRELVTFEREHIRKENELLYPAVKKEFTGKSLADVTRELWSDRDAMARIAEDAWLRSLADELIREHAPESKA